MDSKLIFSLTQLCMSSFGRRSLRLSKTSLIGRRFSSGTTDNHNPINIHKEGVTPQRSKLSKEELLARQKVMMGRGLPKRQNVEGVKKVVLVSSGKGGVGKSTVAGN